MFHPSPLFIGIGLLHALACLAILFGILFLAHAFMQSLSTEKIRSYGVWLFVAGVVVCILTTLLAPLSFHGYRSMNREKGMMMQCMMDGKDGKECPMMKSMKDGKEMKGMMNDGMPMMQMDDEMMDPMAMSMTDMAEMLKGKTGTEFDIAFVKGMIPHHQGAIDMAMEARKSAGHQEIKKMAEDIITAQQKEIDMMNAWLKEWEKK